jgi:hypothetical protein
MRGTKRNENLAVEASTVNWERIRTVGSEGLPPLAALWDSSWPRRSISTVGGSGSSAIPVISTIAFR